MDDLHLHCGFVCVCVCVCVRARACMCVCQREKLHDWTFVGDSITLLSLLLICVHRSVCRYERAHTHLCVQSLCAYVGVCNCLFSQLLLAFFIACTPFISVPSEVDVNK